MPAPNTPNTAEATRVRRAKGDRTAADRLIRAGWTVTPPNANPGSGNPEQAETLRRLLASAADRFDQLADNIRDASDGIGTAPSYGAAVGAVQAEILTAVSDCTIGWWTALAAQADTARGGVEAG